MTTTLILTIAFFLTVILMLVSLLLFVKAKLSPAGKLKITINGEQTLEVDGGSTADHLGQQRGVLAIRLRWRWHVRPVPLPGEHGRRLHSPHRDTPLLTQRGWPTTGASVAR